MGGPIIWDSNIKIVTHLFAVYVIKIMMKMKAEGNWKTEGIVIGMPAYEFSIQLKRKKRKKNEEEEPEEKPNGKWILANQIPLSPLQAEEFLNFLARNEDSLQRVALAEEGDRKRRLSQVYEILFVAVIVWSAVMLSYYAFYAYFLLYVGLPNLNFMLFSNRQSTTYWADL
jgi:hypothetical protein